MPSTMIELVLNNWAGRAERAKKLSAGRTPQFSSMPSGFLTRETQSCFLREPETILLPPRMNQHDTQIWSDPVTTSTATMRLPREVHNTIPLRIWIL